MQIVDDFLNAVEQLRVGTKQQSTTAATVAITICCE
jgi:hypothetical protein